MNRILGNTDFVKKSTLEYMETFLDAPSFEGFVPYQVLEMMRAATLDTGREVSVIIDRRGKVLSIALGDERSVKVDDKTKRTSEARLAGVRQFHTHPGGSAYPSSVDLNTLKTMRLDAMVIIGVSKEKGTVTGICPCILSRGENGEFTEPEIFSAYLPSRIDELDFLYSRIDELDRSSPETVMSYISSDEPQRAILAGVIYEKSKKDTDDPEELLAELKELAESAGAVVVGAYVQRRQTPDSAMYIGRGLAKDMALARQAKNAQLVIFDDELSPSQIRNLENTVGGRVIDRTALILDIFAARAKSREGRLQVELAQQKYRLPRLTGTGIAMSRLGGGIGTRGPGETKLQSDKRHIQRRILHLENQLKEVSERRELLRNDRKRKDVPTAALVGYTNAGKSTILNAMCDCSVYAEDKLFATLDSTVRRMNITDGKDILMADTVGFIKKLPHDLVEAFKSTLEEAAQSDLILHVADASDEDLTEKIEIVERILSDIKAVSQPRFLVLNKIDKVSGDISLPFVSGYDGIYKISAANNLGLDSLRDKICEHFAGREQSFTLSIPYSEGWVIPYIHKYGTVDNEDFSADGTVVTGRIPVQYYSKICKFEN